MDASTLASIKEKLESEKARLEQELKLLGHHQTEDGTMEPNFPQFGDKEDENAAEVALFSDNKSLEDTLERELRDVIKALDRMKEGKYGICKYCKQQIPLQRLLARPESSSCVNCKEQLSK